MMVVTVRPDLSALEVPMDRWTEPFWTATAGGALLFPRCGVCGRFRWPPGPFCRHCHAQYVDWVAGGAATIYSYTLVPEGERIVAPALISFVDAPGIRLPAAIVESATESIAIGRNVRLDFTRARNATMPVFIVDDKCKEI